MQQEEGNARRSAVLYMQGNGRKRNMRRAKGEGADGTYTYDNEVLRLHCKKLLVEDAGEDYERTTTFELEVAS